MGLHETNVAGGVQPADRAAQRPPLRVRRPPIAFFAAHLELDKPDTTAREQPNLEMMLLEIWFVIELFGVCYQDTYPDVS